MTMPSATVIAPIFQAKIAIVAALEREVGPLIENWTRVPREHEGRQFFFFENDGNVAICGGIGAPAARRATEAAIALYRPWKIYSTGFAGALDPTLRAGQLFSPSLLLDARDGSRIPLTGLDGTLITFMEVAGTQQKEKLAAAYAARAVDMEAAAVAAAAQARGIPFAATKVISDELGFEIPGGSGFVDGQGQFQTLRFIVFAALRPWLWPRVARLARNSGKAARVLSAHLQEICGAAAPLASSGRSSTVSSAALPAGGRK